MAASLVELLQPQVILDVISRLKKGRGPLASWLGFQPMSFDPETVTVSGPNTIPGSGSVRQVSYRIFDHTRVPMKGRAPGTGPGTVAQNPMGTNNISIARYHQKISLGYEFLGQLTPMIGPNSVIDAGGKDYIQRQTTFLGEQANNMVEMMGAGMMRDSLYFIVVGDNWLPSFTPPSATQFGFQINFLIPATNKGQLPNQMGTNIGGGNLLTVGWQNPNAPILGDLQSIRAAYALLSRYTMTDIWINSTLWTSIILNQQIRNAAGAVNTPFATWTQLPDAGFGGTGPSNKFKATLTGIPGIEWHFCDDALALNTDIDPSYGTAPASASLAKLIPDGMAIFSTEPGPEWCRMHLGGEYVVENPGMAGVLRTGWYFWHEFVTQPSAVELLGLLNAVPILYVPLVIAPATVVF
jgi:hypothetical protein